MTPTPPKGNQQPAIYPADEEDANDASNADAAWATALDRINGKTSKPTATNEADAAWDSAIRRINENR